MKTPEKENVTAVLAGRVVYLNYEIGNTYTIMLQHDNYLSIYRNTLKSLKNVGDAVAAGESIALVADQLLWFEIWQNGQSINPEEIIAF